MVFLWTTDEDIVDISERKAPDWRYRVGFDRLRVGVPLGFRTATGV